MSFLDLISNIFSPPVVGPTTGGLTVANVKSAISILQQTNVEGLNAAFTSNFSNLNDDELVLNEVLSVLSVFFPQVAGIETLIKLLEVLTPVITSNISLHQMNNPVIDAQTSMGGNHER